MKPANKESKNDAHQCDDSCGCKTTTKTEHHTYSRSVSGATKRRASMDDGGSNKDSDLQNVHTCMTYSPAVLSVTKRRTSV